MKKKTLGIALGIALSLSLAGGLVALSNVAKGANAALGDLYYTADFSKASAISSGSITSTYDDTDTVTLTDGTRSFAWSCYGSNTNSYAVAGTRFGGKNTTTALASTLTNPPSGLTTTYYQSNLKTTAVIPVAVQKIEITLLASFGTVAQNGSIYVQASLNSDFSSSTEPAAQAIVASSTITITPTTAFAANSYYRIIFSKTTATTTNTGIILATAKFYDGTDSSSSSSASTGTSTSTSSTTSSSSSSASFGTLSSIAVSTAATTTSFETGSTFASSGLALTATDTLGTTKAVTSGFTTDYDSHVFADSDVGTKIVTVSYSEGSVTATTTYSITVTLAPAYTYTFATGNFGTTYTAVTSKTFNSLAWTLSMTDSAYLGFDSTTSRGLQFGSSTDPATAVTLASDLFATSGKFLISKILIVTCTASSGNATVALSINGTAVGSATALNTTTTTTAHDVIFTPTSPVSGHLEFTYVNSASKALYIKSITVYGEAPADTDLASALSFAASLEPYKTCSEASTAYAALNPTYTALSATAKTDLSSISLYDYGASDTSYTGVRSLQVTAAAKWARIASIYASSAFTVSALNGNGATASLVILAIIALLGMSTTGAYFVTARKKHR